MTYLLDTSIVIEVLRERRHFENIVSHEIALPIHVHYEIMVGIERSRTPELKSKKRHQYSALLECCRVVPYESAHAERAAVERARLEARGEMIGPIDLLIAAQALELNGTLVSKNLREFIRVEGLSVISW